MEFSAALVAIDPWGSGGNQNKRNKAFLDTIADMRKEGLSATEIARVLSTPDHPFTTTMLRDLTAIARNEQKQTLINTAQRLADKGMSNSAIGRKMEINESSVRALLEPGAKHKADVLDATSDMLKRQVEEKGYIDVGTDVYRNLPIGDNPGAPIGISSTKFNTAVAKLREEGYAYHQLYVKQAGTGNYTNIKVLAKPGVTRKEAFLNRAQVRQITEKSDDGGLTYDSGFQTPIAISSRRVGIRYGEDGGGKADGMIYVRPGIDDISLGGSNYAQVRVAVGDGHYLKGMAVYKDDLPVGVDLMFNTNKKDTGNKLEALKKQSDDPDIPFGAMVRQLKDNDGNVKSAMNIVNEEGDWDTWSRNLPTQMLSKQSPTLAKTQLDLTYDRRSKELDEISALTNPVVRKKLLESFADDADSASVHLKAAAMPKQATKVLIPIKSIKEHEVYAPSFADGTRLALVRFPHGGTFEIPQVTVNNRNREAKKTLKSNAIDAIGLNHKVAERLSGADFDGDTVLAIPNNRGDIKSTPGLSGLKDFDPRASYKPYDGMKTVDGGTYNAKKREVEYFGKKPNGSGMQQQMGDVSNLVTDMTLRGAGTDELARAVRHSMVVIDAEKHGLDYRSSAKDNGIGALKQKYQGKTNAGASTLISRAKSQQHVNARRPRPAKDGGPIDKATGKRVYVDTGETYVNRTGKTVPIRTRSKKLVETGDAHTLSSGTRIERVYGDYSNSVKGLANRARKEAVNTKTVPPSPSAKKVYAKEVDSLNSKLNIARKNAPLERQAQVFANGVVSQKRDANPHLTQKDFKKIESQALAQARARTGAKKQRIDITPSEWQAIQARAISANRLEQILNNSDIDTVRKYATPRTKILMTSSMTARAAGMLARGFTQAEVAAQLGVSLTTLKDSL
jgi:DNA-binding CsgD family transcriptional regulator